MPKINKERRLKKYIKITNRRKKIKGGKFTDDQKKKYIDFNESINTINNIKSDDFEETIKKFNNLYKEIKEITKIEKELNLRNEDYEQGNGEYILKETI